MPPGKATFFLLPKEQLRGYPSRNRLWLGGRLLTRQGGFTVTGLRIVFGMAMWLLVMPVCVFGARARMENAGSFSHALLQGAGAAEKEKKKRQTLADLPVAAQAAISTGIGRDDRSYHAVELEVQADGSGAEAAAARRGYRVENRRQVLEAEFTAAGVTVRSGSAVLGMKLVGYGYGALLQAVGAAEPQAEANRVEYRRGEVTEWYVNGPLGLEQGFTVARAPVVEGREGRGPLSIALALDGGWRVEVDGDGQGARLVDRNSGGERVLRYRGLVAHDARGKELRAWVEAERERLWLRVEDAGAEYPVVVDPFIQQAKLTASDGAAADQFGISVGISGDVVVVGAVTHDVGANANQGAAYVFVKPPGGWAGTMTETAKLLASDGAANDSFGASIAISLDIVAVGAPGATIGANLYQGAVYVFVKPIGGWTGIPTESAKLIASDGAADDSFGWSVGVSMSTVVVGVPWAQVGNFNAGQGALYLFKEPLGGWSGAVSETAKLTASDGDQFDYLGWSVGIWGGILVAGAFWDDVGPNTEQGSAYVFEDVPPTETPTSTPTETPTPMATPTGTPVGVCPPTPLAGCDVAERAGILIRDYTNSARDLFRVKLARNNPPRTGSELSNPTATATFTVCMWHNSALIAQLVAPPGANWSALKGNRGYRYFDSTLAQDGLRSMLVRAGRSGAPRKTSVLVRGQGLNLPDPALPLSSPVNVTVQVIDTGSGICFRQSFGSSHVRKNRASRGNTIREFLAVRK